MSVLARQRTTSKAEFINTAIAINDETIGLLSRLSARYQRLIGDATARLAGEVQDHAEKANSIYPNTEQRQKQRLAHLLEARASLRALDVRLAQVVRILLLNPQGAFVNGAGQRIPPKQATERIDKMCQSLGEKIDREDSLLAGAAKGL